MLLIFVLCYLSFSIHASVTNPPLSSMDEPILPSENNSTFSQMPTNMEASSPGKLYKSFYFLTYYMHF